MSRPEITNELAAEVFLTHYYLKTELTLFCKQEGLQATGSKTELTQRIAHYLKTGEKLRKSSRPVVKKHVRSLQIDDQIEANFVCSEVHRAFYNSVFGDSFSFNVPFQKWLKQNSGKTYRESISAYHQLLAEKKQTTTSIDSQFEYNTYIRDFFAENKGATLAEAITCWNYKKAISGHHRYEATDLQALPSD